MKRIISIALMLCLICVSFVACGGKKNNGPADNSAREESLTIIGTWQVATGAESHKLVFSKNNTVKMINGKETATANFGYDGETIVVESEDEAWSGISFKLIEEKLVRYENGEEDGYTYTKVETSKK